MSLQLAQSQIQTQAQHTLPTALPLAVVEECKTAPVDEQQLQRNSKVSLAAAAKGRAITTLFTSLKDHVSSQEPYYSMSNPIYKLSVQEIFADYPLIIKRSSPSAREEEQTTLALFTLYSGDGFLHSFPLKSLDFNKNGIADSLQNPQLLSYAYPLSTACLMRLEERLEDEDFWKFKDYLKDVKKNKGCVSFESHHFQEDITLFKKKNYEISLDQGSSWQQVDFFTLQRMYLKEEVNISTLIKRRTFPAISLGEFEKLHAVLENGWRSKPLEELYFIPILHEAYEACYGSEWKIFNSLKKEWEELSFKELQQRWHEGRLNKHVHAQRKGEAGSGRIGDYQQLYKALTQTRWRLIFSRPYLINASGRFGGMIEHIDAKPCLSEMSMMKSVSERNIHHILQTFDDTSTYNAILTGELQMYDLHAGNIGFEPMKNALYKKYEDVKFLYSTLESSEYKCVRLAELIQDQLSRAIVGQTVVKVILPDRLEIIEKPLAELSEIQKLFSLPFKLVLFDGDNAVAEDNTLAFQTYKGKPGSLIPFRNDLLVDEWVKKPISLELFEKLLNLDQVVEEVRSWVNRSDAPIRRWISKKRLRTIDLLIKPLIQQEVFTFSYWRQQEDVDPTSLTMTPIIKRFAKQLASLADHPEVWEIIQAELASKTWHTYLVKSGDTPSSIAARYRLTPEELRSLNGGQETFSVGDLVVVRDSLVSGSSIARRQRKKIAKQLHPRLTWKQKAALFDRQDSRKKYLQAYKEIQKHSLAGTTDPKLFADFIRAPWAPLNSIERQELSEIPPEGLAAVLADISYPTFENIMMAYYPLLGDQLALERRIAQLTDAPPFIAGTIIGNFECSLESRLLLARELLTTSADQNLEILITVLEEKIGMKKAMKDPVRQASFAGSWT